MIIVFASHCHNQRILPFPDPVVDPAPPGVNPTEPVFPIDRPCKKVHVYQNNCYEQLDDLRREISELKDKIIFLQEEKPLSCLGELPLLSNAIKEFIKKEDVTLKLLGSKVSYEVLIDGEYLDASPKFYKNIRYTKETGLSCVLDK